MVQEKQPAEMAGSLAIPRRYCYLPGNNRDGEAENYDALFSLGCTMKNAKGPNIGNAIIKKAQTA